MLMVNEIFGKTIQGEGKSAGKEVLFLRLSGCNLACSWCDTPYTWNWKGTKFVHPDKFKREDEVRKYTVEQVLSLLKLQDPKTKAVVISGGEPMLQQRELINLLRLLKKDKYWVEVETNGTIAPLPEFVKLISQINCSPKLANSGPDNAVRRRENPAALKALVSSSKTSFKFVISQTQDITEIYELLNKYRMKPQSVYLMPEGRTKQEQLAHQDVVEEMARTHGFNFSPRLHVLQWDVKRAV